MKSMKKKRIIGDAVCQTVLTVLAVIWLVPIVWIALQAFREEPGFISYTFFPEALTFNNFFKLFDNTMFGRWFLNTAMVAAISCIIATLLTLMVAYVMSRFRFKARKKLLNIALVLGMFPGFMSMIAVYYILKALNLHETLAALVLVYSGSAGLGFYVAKGFFDTVPKTLDEAARIDGATNITVFIRLILPLSKPMIVYTALMAFMGPWSDFIFAKVIMGTNRENYTVAIGLFEFLETDKINTYFTMFAAGSLIIGVLISAVFMFLQKYYVEGITGGSVKG